MLIHYLESQVRISTLNSLPPDAKMRKARLESEIKINKTRLLGLFLSLPGDWRMDDVVCEVGEGMVVGFLKKRQEWQGRERDSTTRET